MVELFVSYCVLTIINYNIIDIVNKTGPGKSSAGA